MGRASEMVGDEMITCGWCIVFGLASGYTFLHL